MFIGRGVVFLSSSAKIFKKEVKMGINPNQSGLSGGGQTIAPQSVSTATPVSALDLAVDERGQSSLGRSDKQPLVIEFVASLPNLSVSTRTSLYSGLSNASPETLVNVGMSLSQSYNDAVNQMLDDWNEQIKVQGEIAKQSAIKKSVQDNVQKSQRNQDQVVKHDVESSKVVSETVDKSQLRELSSKVGASSSEFKETSKNIDTNFVTKWKKLSQTQKNQFRDTVGNQALKVYRSSYNDPVQQNEDVKKMMPVLTTLFFTEVFEINPLAADIVMRPIGDVAGTASILPDVIAAAPGVTMEIPQINLMIPLPMYSTAVEASLNVLANNKGMEGKLSPEKIDEEFVQEFAKKALEKTNDMSKFMTAIDPQYLLLPESQKQNVNVLASMLTLTTVLVLDVKSQADFSNLSPEEFSSLLKNGVPGNDLLSTVTNQINVSLSQIPDKNQRVDYVNFLLNYIVKSSSSSVSDLKSFANALMYASQTIGTDVRALSTPD